MICDALSGSLLSHPFKTRHHTEMLQHPFNFQMQSKWDLDKINAKTQLMLRKKKKKSLLEGISGPTATSVPTCLKVGGMPFVEFVFP